MAGNVKRGRRADATVGTVRSQRKTQIQAAAEAEMFSNNLNGAYEYESERRNDERRAAAENQLLRGLGGKGKLSGTSLMAILVILAVLLFVIRIF